MKYMKYLPLVMIIAIFVAALGADLVARLIP
jgi:hypothetical protein